jgi:diadenosine tetraphosphate (Ap4A) HIT family hydrolase
MNETILRFGYPDTLIAEYRHWLVLLRPDQPTLGSLVLAATGAFTALPDVPPEGFAELRGVVQDIEASLGRTVRYERINYLMLMMVDPHVHWHVVPRYEGIREAAGVTVADAGWPKVPQLAEAVKLAPEQIAALAGWLRPNWVTSSQLGGGPALGQRLGDL